MSWMDGCTLARRRAAVSLALSLVSSRVKNTWTHLQEVPRGGPSVERRLLEHHFVFACIWSFGGCMLVDGTSDYQAMFSKWWVQEWKTVPFPEKVLAASCIWIFEHSWQPSQMPCQERAGLSSLTCLMSGITSSAPWKSGFHLLYNLYPERRHGQESRLPYQPS